MQYRLRKETVMRLEEYIGHNIEPGTHRNQCVSAVNQILVTLRFLATGAFQILLGDSMNFYKTTVCHIVQWVIPQIASLHDTFIFMPSNER